MNRPDYQDLLRMNDAERRKLLDRVDINGAEASGARGPDVREKRKDQRWSYRDRSIAVMVEHPAGGISRYLTTPRNISAGGIAFLHGGFLHKASKCRVNLVRLDGKAVSLIGQVATCRHVDGVVHEVGLKFDQIIDPAQFVRMQSDDQREDSGSTEQVSMEVPHLDDDILFIGDSNADLKFLAHQLKSTGINMSTATTPNEAKRLVKAKPFDIILCDQNISGYNGLDVIKSLREHGFKGPIALVATGPDAAPSNEAKAVGVSQVLAKPYSPERLMELLAGLHDEAVAIRKNVASTVTSTPATAAATPSIPVEAHRKAG